MLLGIFVERQALQITFTPHMPLPFHILYNRCGCFPVIMLVEQTVSLIYLGKLSDLVESGCLSSVKCWVKKKPSKTPGAQFSLIHLSLEDTGR